MAQKHKKNENKTFFSLKGARSARRSERGNVFFTLFGAVAVVGVLGAGIMATMRGPLSTMVEVNRSEQARSEIRLATNLILVASDDETCEGSGNGDGYVEGIPPDAGTITGGGVIPSTVSAVKQDPWGTPYGYCAWNHGPGAVAADTDACGTVLEGNTDTNNIAIVVVSAGPDRTFQTSCVADASGSNDYVEPDEGGGDDILTAITYNGAVAGSGGLWTPVGTGTAQIARNLDVAGGAAFTGDVDLSSTPSAALRLGAASLFLPTQAEAPDSSCDDAGDSANHGILRINTSTDPDGLEICDSSTTTWQLISSGSSLWTEISTGRIYYGSTGNGYEVGINNNNPSEALDVEGNIQLSENVMLSAAKSVVWVSGASITENSGTLEIDANAGAGVELTIDQEYAGFLANVSITQQGIGDPLIVDTDSFIVKSSGNVGIGDDSPNDELDVSGSVDITEKYKIDGTDFLTNNDASGTLLAGGDAGSSVTGGNNTILGSGAAATLVGGTDNIVVGQGADVSGAAATNELNIGDVIVGDLTGASQNVGIGYTPADISGFNDMLEVNGNIDSTGSINATNNITAGDDVGGDNVYATSQIYVGGNTSTGDILGPPPNCSSSEKLEWNDGVGWSCETDLNDGSSGSADDLESVLTAGNDANGLDAVNFGNVGIGTSSPAAPLDVLSAAGAQMRLSYDGTYYSTFEVTSAGQLNIRMPSSNIIDIGPANANTSRFQARFDGDLSGIGGMAFQTNEANNSTIFTTVPNGTGVGSYFKFCAQSSCTSGGYGQVGKTNSELSFLTDVAGSNGSSPITFYTKPSGGSSTERMRITSTGTVGIGTTAPSTGGDQDLELDVEGDIGAINYCDEDGNNCFSPGSINDAPGNDTEIIINDGGVFGTNPLFVLVGNDGGPSGCTNIGDLCPDGTYYAGLSPDGDIPMFMATSASELAFSQFDGGFGGEVTGATSTTDGNGNTPILVAEGLDDNGPYPPAELCDSLSAHGYSDWYLPAQDELNLIWNGGTPVGDIQTDGTSYWSSTEDTISNAFVQEFSTGAQSSSSKAGVAATRCVRQAGMSGATAAVGIGTATPSTGGEQDLELDVEGDIGADNYCDEDGNNCYDILDLVEDDDWIIGTGVLYTEDDVVVISGVAADGTLSLDVNGQIGATEYCDENGANCFDYTDLGGGGGGVALSDITDATAVNTLTNASWNQIWNWQLSGSEVGFTIGETAASSGGSGNQYLFRTSTLATSTATPLYVQNLGDAISFQVDDASSDTSPFVIDAAGQVGIGTSAPDDFMEIEGALGGAGLHIDSSSGVGIALDRGAQANHYRFRFQTAGVDEWLVGNAGLSNGNLVFSEDSTADSTLVLEEGGNIGIGQSNPAAKLDIATANDGDAILRLGTDRHWTFEQEGDDAATALRLRNTSGANKNFFIDTDGRFQLRDSTGASIYFTARADTSSVGIGDDSPDSGTGGQLLLDVNGPVGATAYCDENGDNCFDYNDISGSGDNLGNHTATQALNMATYDITGAGSIGATDIAVTSANGILWETDVNRITNNDGGGNVQIRFGNEYSGGALYTHGGGAAWITSNIDSSSDNTYLRLQVSDNTGAGDGAAVTWGSALDITDQDLTWGGNTTLSGTLNTTDAISVDGNTVIDNGGGWHRSYGNTGWYNGTHGGGIYMTDTTWVRVYNNKSFLVSGDIQYSGVLTDASDRRLKTDIRPLDTEGIMDRLSQVNTYSFVMKEDKKNQREYGVIAQELEEIFPELVYTADDEMGTKTVNYIGLIAPIIETAKTLKNENDVLKAKVAALETAQKEVDQNLVSLNQQVDLLNKVAGKNVSKASVGSWMFILIALLGGVLTGAMIVFGFRKSA